MLEGSAWYGRAARITVGEWLTLATTPRDEPCRYLLGCGGLATGYQRDRTTMKLVTACEAHRHKGRW